MILSCSNICKSFGENDILKQVSFHIEDHEKAAIVGINGAGKSTLLKVLIGKLAADDGVVTWARVLPLVTVAPSLGFSTITFGSNKIPLLL